MSVDQAERWLYELERAAEKLQRDVRGIRARGVSLDQRKSRLVQAAAYMTIQRTTYGKWRIPSAAPSVLRVLGCGAEGRAGATVTINDAVNYDGTTGATGTTDPDGYFYWDHGNAADTSGSASVSAGGGYEYAVAAPTTNNLVSFTTIQTVADTDHVCLSSCSAPVLVAGQKVTVAGTTATLVSRGLLLGGFLSGQGFDSLYNAFSASVAVGGDCYKATNRTGNNRLTYTGPSSGTYTVTVYVGRAASTGHLRVLVEYYAITDTSFVYVAGPVDDTVPSASGTGTYVRQQRRAGVNTSAYTCSSLTGTIDFSGTDAETCLGITSVEIADP
jgi:hypothetical protein